MAVDSESRRQWVFGERMGPRAAKRRLEQAERDCMPLERQLQHGKKKFAVSKLMLSRRLVLAGVGPANISTDWLLNRQSMMNSSGEPVTLPEFAYDSIARE